MCLYTFRYLPQRALFSEAERKGLPNCPRVGILMTRREGVEERDIEFLKTSNEELHLSGKERTRHIATRQREQARLQVGKLCLANENPKFMFKSYCKEKSKFCLYLILKVLS